MSEEKMLLWVKEHKQVLAGAAVLLALALLAFSFVLKGTMSGALVVEETRVQGTLTMEKVRINVGHSNGRLSSSSPIIIETGNREINVTGSVDLEGFDGTASWDGTKMMLEGSLESVHGTGLDISWARPESTTITLTTGLADFESVRLRSFSENANGHVTLQGKITAKLSSTQFRMKDFNGRMYLQRAAEETTLGFDGSAGSVRIKEDNVLKILV